MCAWNVRGHNTASKMSMVNWFDKKEKVSLMAVLETKIEKIREVEVRSVMLP